MAYTYRTVVLTKNVSTIRRGMHELVKERTVTYDLQSLKDYSIRVSFGERLKGFGKGLGYGTGGGVFLATWVWLLWWVVEALLGIERSHFQRILLLAPIPVVVGLLCGAIGLGNVGRDKAVKLRAKEDKIPWKRIEAVEASDWAKWLATLDERTKPEISVVRIPGDKRCGHCRTQLHAATTVGELCPNCNATFVGEDRVVM
jgi:hypothetical protein